MTLKDMRRAIVNQLEDNWSQPVEVYYENAEEVDVNNIDEFVKCDIYFDGAEQSNIAFEPFYRTYGTLVLEIFVRQSTGTEKALDYMEEFTSIFKHKNLSGVHMQTPEPGKTINSKGWHSITLRTKFYADSNV